MQIQDWIEAGWRLFCPCAAEFWRLGFRGLDEEPLVRENQWYEDEEDADQEIDWLDFPFIPEEDRGDPVFRIIGFPPAFVWIGAMYSFLQQNGIRMGLLRIGARALIVQIKPQNSIFGNESSALGNPSSSRCGKCPYFWLCGKAARPGEGGQGA